jgi:ring-1,2-phenylacetyl-CoA epoxidase subunit PaaE
MEDFFPLTVQEVIRETPDAVTLSFSPVEDTKFRFQAGQYLTLRVNIDGKTFRRAYSLSASPLDKRLNITVKQVQGGKVSPYLCNQIAAGASLEILPPMGDFTFQPATEKGKSYFMFAGGSGITPIFSILKTILQTEPQSNVYLFFGNKNKQSIIFREELAALEAKYPNQFFVDWKYP